MVLVTGSEGRWFKFYLWFFEFEEAVEHSGQDVNWQLDPWAWNLQRKSGLQGRLGVELKLY